MDAKLHESDLIHSCLNNRPFAWQKFVDRYLPVVLKTIQEINVQSNRSWAEETVQTLTRNVFQKLRDNDCKLLASWDTESDFDTWLVVASRRITLGPDPASQ